MTNILNKNLDITDFFVNDELDKIAELSENLSEHAKITDIPLLEDFSTKNDKNFALVLVSPRGETYSKYAIYNPGITELNINFLSNLEKELPEEVVKIAASNLCMAAAHHNITIPENLTKYKSGKYVSRYLDVLNIDEKAYLEKVSNLSEVKEDKKYALKNKYPISNEVEIMKSAEWFDRNYVNLDIDEQQEFIKNITQSMKDTNYEKTAGIIDDFNSLDKDTFSSNYRDHLKSRKSFLLDNEDEDKSEIFDDLWSKKDEIGPYKSAYVLEVIDKELGLDSMYGAKILDPLRSVLGTIKTASINYNGKEITQKALTNLKSMDVGPIVGEGVVSELKSDNGLVVFNSLPDPLKDEISELV